MTKTIDYEKLPAVVKISSVGLPGLTAKCIKRTDKKALYLRGDNVYEVFVIKIDNATEIFGREYPKREAYPNNEDFGSSAWTYRDEKSAMDKYNRI